MLVVNSNGSPLLLRAIIGETENVGDVRIQHCQPHVRLVSLLHDYTTLRNEYSPMATIIIYSPWQPKMIPHGNNPNELKKRL
jgi:hypothetical protein